MELESGKNTIFSSGTIIANRYEVLKQLGSGGMGFVVRAVDHTLDNDTVALKLLYPHLVSDPVIFARFRNEVLVARRLAHPNIVRLYDFGNTGGGYYFISMEYVSGHSLADRIYHQRRNKLSFEEILHVLYQIGLGIAHAHAKGVVHRDLKPDNILISENKEVKITDFGLARTLDVDRGFTATGEAVGTPHYMAPEQIRGDAVDGRCDIYSLGIIAYELVVGQKPFDSEVWFTLAAMHLNQKLPDFASLVPGIPKWYEAFVKRSTEKSREDRFQSVLEWLDVLEKNLPGNAQPFSALAKSFPSLLAPRLSTAHQVKKKIRMLRKRYAYSSLFFVVCVLCLIGSYRLFYPASQRLLVSLVLSSEHRLGINLAWMKRSLGAAEVELKLPKVLSYMKNGNSKALDYALQAGFNVNAQDTEGTPLIVLAFNTRNENVITILLRYFRYGPQVNATDSSGITPLMIAVEMGEPTIVSNLLALGANVSAHDKNGLTPLMRAVKMKSIGMVQTLLAAGAFADYTDGNGFTALIYAAQAGDTAILQLLLNVIDRRERVEENRKAALDARDTHGWTALMHAAAAGHLDLLPVLVSRGANYRVTNNAGQTVLDLVPAPDRNNLERILKHNITQKDLPTDDKRRKKEEERFSQIPSNQSTGETSSPPNSQISSSTRLRVTGKAQPRWLNLMNSYKILGIAPLNVFNAGETTAQGVKVVAKLSNGREIPLRGPNEILPNASASYSNENLDGAEELRLLPLPDRFRPTAEDVKIEVTCQNCRR